MEIPNSLSRRPEFLVKKREAENFDETLQHMIDIDHVGQQIADRFSIVFLF